MKRVGIFAIWICGVAAAEMALPQQLEFEVASVRVNKTGDARTDGVLAGNRFSMINETLWRLIGEAYATSQPLPRVLIVGGPDWINTDRFDVEAVAQSTISRDQARLMLRTLLRQRFQLSVHTEARQSPIYALVPARADGKLGPRLHPASAPCERLGAGSPQQSRGPAQIPICMMGFGFGRLSTNGMSLTEMATIGLSRYTDRPVVDRTGLIGPYEWILEWTPDNLPQRAAPDQPLRVNGIIVDPNGPSLFTALQEQLGLKLESTTGPVDVVVIDHVEHPTVN